MDINNNLPPRCPNHGTLMYLRFYDRPGSPPGNGYVCSLCIREREVAQKEIISIENELTTEEALRKREDWEISAADGSADEQVLAMIEEIRKLRAAKLPS